MSVIANQNTKKRIYNNNTTTSPSAFSLTELRTKYLEYAKAQESERMLWYMKSIMVIPCAIMVPSIFLMAMATSSYVWFVGLCVILFFANLVVHIAEFSGRIFVPVYQFSIAVMFLIPVITYLVKVGV